MDEPWFTEVQYGDPEWDTDQECDIFEFLYYVDIEVSEYIHECVHMDDSEEPITDHYGAPSVGVLAYEVDAS
ncbi:MAG: hypothetical protein Q9157_000481 [Trypethelium eluteriae]